jgi:hypothetical protein
MANVTGLQPDIKYCPICKGCLTIVKREDMVSAGYVSVKTGLVAEHTHTYKCGADSDHKFEINQARPPELKSA